MRRWTMSIVLICAGALVSFGQGLDNPQVIEKLKLTPTEVTKLEEIRTRSERTAREAKLEIDILQARIKRMLYNATVDLKEVESVMRQAMEWELKQRMAHISGQVEARRLLGDDRWAKLNAMSTERARRQERMQEKAQNPADSPQPSKRN